LLTLRRGSAVVALTLLVAGAAACGDSDDEGTTPTSEGSAAQVVEVTAVDYGYEDVPTSVAAGTQLSLTNASDKEIHELVAFLLPEDEDRSAEEIAGLPEAELGALFQGAPATVLIAPPNAAEMIPALGDGTLSEPGRYLLFCGIPVGADPQKYLDAAATGAGEGPPEVEGGAPHFTQGMYADLTVE
jgi:hypothetical protein